MQSYFVAYLFTSDRIFFSVFPFFAHTDASIADPNAAVCFIEDRFMFIFKTSANNCKSCGLFSAIPPLTTISFTAVPALRYSSKICRVPNAQDSIKAR